MIDISKVKKELDAFTTLKQRIDYLSEAYPGLNIFILEHLKL